MTPLPSRLSFALVIVLSLFALVSLSVAAAAAVRPAKTSAASKPFQQRYRKVSLAGLRWADQAPKSHDGLVQRCVQIFNTICDTKTRHPNVHIGMGTDKQFCGPKNANSLRAHCEALYKAKGTTSTKKQQTKKQLGDKLMKHVRKLASDVHDLLDAIDASTAAKQAGKATKKKAAAVDAPAPSDEAKTLGLLDSLKTAWNGMKLVGKVAVDAYDDLTDETNGQVPLYLPNQLPRLPSGVYLALRPMDNIEFFAVMMDRARHAIVYVKDGAYIHRFDYSTPKTAAAYKMCPNLWNQNAAATNAGDTGGSVTASLRGIPGGAHFWPYFSSRCPLESEGQLMYFGQSRLRGTSLLRYVQRFNAHPRWKTYRLGDNNCQTYASLLIQMLTGQKDAADRLIRAAE